MFDIFAVGIVALVFLGWLGYALTGWLLPRSLGSLRWAALPWTGYAAFVVLAQFATQAGLNMAQTALLALVLALGANALYLRWGGAGLGAVATAPSRIGWIVAGLTALVFLLGVLPLLFYGYHTIIGENWDGEIYLALGEYLRTYAQPALGQAPPNPLLHILLVPPYSGRTHGFSYFQAATGALTGLPSLVTLGPVLALLRALAVPASYFFFRAGWGWTPHPALTAAAALGLNPFLLWITYNTFGMQVPSLGLLPLCAGAALLALRAAAHADRGEAGRLVAYAALVTAALAVTYHPALTAWVAIAGAGGLAVLLGSGWRWGQVLGAGLALGLGTVVLSAVAQWLSLGGFLAQYAEQTAGLGLTTFTAPTDSLGLSLSFRSLLAAGPGQALLARAVQAYGLLILVAGLICVALGLLWLWGLWRERPPGGLVQAATAGGGLVYMLLFLRPLDYVYGWFKAQSFVAFVLVGAVVGGLAYLGRVIARRRPAQGWRGMALAAALPALALLATLGLLLWQYHWPLRYSAEMMAAAQVQNYVRPGDTALVSNSRLMPGRLFNGVLAYFLRDSRIYGTFHTANSAWDEVQPTGVYTWAVLPTHEPPQLYGYRPANRVWGNPLLSLYQAPRDLLYTQAWEQKGDYPRSTGGAPLSWQVDLRALQPGAAALPARAGGQSRNIGLGLAVFAPQTLGLTVQPAAGAPLSYTVQLAPGLQDLAFDLPAPATLILHPAPDAGLLAVRWTTLHESLPGSAPQPPRAAPPITDVLMLRITGQAQGGTVETTIGRVDTHAPDRQADRVVLDIYRSGGAGGEADHFGYWSFALTGDTATFRVPLPGGAPQAGPGAQLLPDASRRGPAQQGRFAASLTFCHGTTVLDTVTDIYTFAARTGPGDTLIIDNIAVRALPLLFY
jgi:hypothetical protein